MTKLKIIVIYKTNLKNTHTHESSQKSVMSNSTKFTLTGDQRNGSMSPDWPQGLTLDTSV